MTTQTKKEQNQINIMRCQCCGGVLALERDEDTRIPFLSCIQCSREHNMNGKIVHKNNIVRK